MTHPTPLPILMTVDEVAATCRRKPKTVRNWIDSGKLRAVRVGGQRLVDMEELRVFLGTTPSVPELPPANDTAQPSDPRLVPLADGSYEVRILVPDGNAALALLELIDREIGGAS